MSKLLEKASMGYEYIKTKRLLTYMQVKPNQVLTEKHVAGLGFQMKHAGTKNCQIVMKSMKIDLKQTLMLSYYSMPMTPNFIPEGCMALFLSNQSNAVNGQFSIDKLYQMISTFTDLLKNEQLLYDYPGYLKPDKVLERIQWFANNKYLELTADNLYISNIENEWASTTMDFGTKLVIPLIDTYLVVLLAID